MKQTLLNIADRLELRVAEFEGFPRTQATDAMKGMGTDLAKIIRDEIRETGDQLDLEGMIADGVEKALEGLTAPTNNKATKKGKRS